MTIGGAKGLRCPVCGATKDDQDWRMERTVIQLTAPRREKRELTVVTCRVCGHVMQFDAALLAPELPPPLE